MSPHNTRIADERFFPTDAITPMEKEITIELINNHGLFIQEFEFRQRISCYHMRFHFWKRLPKVAFAAIQQIAEQHGYSLQESDMDDDDRFTRWSYDFNQVKFISKLPAEKREAVA